MEISSFGLIPMCDLERKTIYSFFAVLLLLIGCNTKTYVRLVSPYPNPKTVVVTPVLNYSGTENIDMLKVTDIFFSELQQVSGFSVVPVNRTLAEMLKMGIVQIRTPQEVHKLGKALGADMVIVPAITEYNPYYPPIVGVAVQLYVMGEGSARLGKLNSFDPKDFERSPYPIKLGADTPSDILPILQVQRIFNARQREVYQAVREFAKARASDISAYGWKVYLKSQEHYLRFVWYQTTQILLEKLTSRLNQIYLVDDNNKRDR